MAAVDARRCVEGGVMDAFVEVSKDNLPWDLLLLADPSRLQIEKYIYQSRIIALTRDAETIGVVVLWPRGQATEIMNIAVATAFQGCGVGKILLGEARRLARSMGAHTLLIGTGNSSINQLALYQKVGFRIDSVDRDFFLRNYNEPIIENGIPCRDMIRLSLEL